MPVTGPEILLYEKKDKIVIITLNRQERMNAFSVELMERLEEAWKKFDSDEDAWVAILTGAGDKAFCAGRDLVEQAEQVSKADLSKKMVRRPAYSPVGIWKPIIAAINGYALAGGFQLAHDCDIRIAAEHAEIGIPETRWNMGAAWACDLARQMHLAHALELILWGDSRISARRAYEIGWVNRVVPKERLMEEAMSWAERMLVLAPRSVRNLKEIIYRGANLPYNEALAFSKALEQNLIGMEDSLEGPKAFAEKRKPKFKNR